jgi:protein TonB
MSSEERMKAEPCADTFNGCLVDGDAGENAREKKSKRRAVVISIVVQTAGLAALVIAPLLAKPAVMAERIAVPIPPYRSGPAQRHTDITQAPRQQTQRCIWCVQHISPIILTRDESRVTGESIDIGPGIDIPGTGSATSLINSIGSKRQPPPPPERQEKKRVIVGHIDPALLRHRVEPTFPALARQLHKSGRVELHAVIGVDGSVQSLQVVSGDPLFVNSAREAVLQWRYKPTYLNGNPVEVETFITVIYTLQQ